MQLDIFATVTTSWHCPHGVVPDHCADCSLDAPAARRRDPETSKAAAASAKDLQARHAALIVDCLKKHGPAGKDRLGALTSMTGVQCCRRLSELARAKLVRLTGKTVPSTSGRQEREWEAA